MRAAEILELLPDVFKQTAADDDDLLTVLLGLMEALHEADERVLAELDGYLDPRRTPDDFVHYLSWWVNLAWLFLDPPDDPYAEFGRPFSNGEGRLRELVASAARQAKWRGTLRGVERMLELATGATGFRIQEVVFDEGDQPVPFQIQMHVPPVAEAHLDLVRRIVEHEKPAHMILHPVIIVDETLGQA